MKKLITFMLLCIPFISCSLKKNVIHTHDDYISRIESGKFVETERYQVWNISDLSKGYIGICVRDHLGNYEYLPNRRLKASIIFDDSSCQEILLDGNNYYYQGWEEKPETAHLYTSKLLIETEKQPIKLKILLPSSDDNQNIEFELS